jgi:hypothetical protein
MPLDFAGKSAENRSEPDETQPYLVGLPCVLDAGNSQQSLRGGNLSLNVVYWVGHASGRLTGGVMTGSRSTRFGSRGNTVRQLPACPLAARRISRLSGLGGKPGRSARGAPACFRGASFPACSLRRSFACLQSAEWNPVFARDEKSKLGSSRGHLSISAKDVNGPLSPRQRRPHRSRDLHGGGRGQGEGGNAKSRCVTHFDLLDAECDFDPRRSKSPLTLPSPPAVLSSQGRLRSLAGGEGTVDFLRRNRKEHPKGVDALHPHGTIV